MTSTPAPWKNRIVGQGEKPASQFTAHPLNWRRHPAAQQSALEAVLDRIGWVQCVVENATTGYLLDGHLRVLSALKKGDETPIPYVQVELTSAEEDTILATLDPLAALAETDRQQLGQLLAGIHSEDAVVANMLKDMALDAQAPGETVSFTVEERPCCPTCGRKLRKGQTLPGDQT